MQRVLYCTNGGWTVPDKTIEQRVTDVEVEVTDLRQEWQNIPDLIDARLRLTDSRVARLSNEMATVKRSLADLSGKVEALPRILAEMLAERDKKR
jgi:uncharacterized protein YPO0396